MSDSIVPSSASSTARSSTCASPQNQASLPEQDYKYSNDQLEEPKPGILSVKHPEDFSYGAVPFPELEPSVRLKSLRARQFLKRHQHLAWCSPDYDTSFRNHWKFVKFSYSFLYLLSTLAEERENEEEWPQGWESDSAFYFFLENTVTSWMQGLSDLEKVDVENLADVMGEFLSIDPNDEAAIESHQSISYAHTKRPEIPQAHELPVASETDIEEEKADDKIPAPVDAGDAANELSRFRVCRNGVFEALESCFGAREEIDAEEGGEEGDDVCRAVEIEERHDEMAF
ncbi:hypothetical protein FBEOM_8912 [Fusarium beomiforme]|uniref:Uncharacterized protein n=1 Tax=Fusarium beomiforme TaxID=44412 RepID=A0A9P5AF31_9HYPO|nr:hypothetical protein FBEOM_8912 [Fusarium beomiforme]